MREQCCYKFGEMHIKAIAMYLFANSAYEKLRAVREPFLKVTATSGLANTEAKRSERGTLKRSG